MQELSRFSGLQAIHVCSCSELTTLQLLGLADNCAVSVSDCSTLRKLVISARHCAPNAALREVHITKCAQLRTLRILFFQGICSLRIWDCPQLGSVRDRRTRPPEPLSHAPAAEREAAPRAATATFVSPHRDGESRHDNTAQTAGLAQASTPELGAESARPQQLARAPSAESVLDVVQVTAADGDLSAAKTQPDNELPQHHASSTASTSRYVPPPRHGQMQHVDERMHMQSIRRAAYLWRQRTAPKGPRAVSNRGTVIVDPCTLALDRQSSEGGPCHPNVDRDGLLSAQQQADGEQSPAAVRGVRHFSVDCYTHYEQADESSESALPEVQSHGMVAIAAPTAPSGRPMACTGAPLPHSESATLLYRTCTSRLFTLTADERRVMSAKRAAWYLAEGQELAAKDELVSFVRTRRGEAVDGGEAVGGALSCSLTCRWLCTLLPRHTPACSPCGRLLSTSGATVFSQSFFFLLLNFWCTVRPCMLFSISRHVCHACRQQQHPHALRGHSCGVSA